jgi:hypothetical protein
MNKPNEEAPKQQKPVERDYYQNSKPTEDPQKSAAKIDWSGASWSGERVRGGWGGGREK